MSWFKRKENSLIKTEENKSYKLYDDNLYEVEYNGVKVDINKCDIVGENNFDSGRMLYEVTTNFKFIRNEINKIKLIINNSEIIEGEIFCVKKSINSNGDCIFDFIAGFDINRDFNIINRFEFISNKTKQEQKEMKLKSLDELSKKDIEEYLERRKN